MPRRSLLLLTTVVLLLHWLVLVGLPLGGGGSHAPQPVAFHTRMLAPQPPQPPQPPQAPEPELQAAPTPFPRPRPVKDPVRRPKPVPIAPAPAAQDSPADANPASQDSPAMDTEPAPPATPEATQASDTTATPEPAAAAASAAEPATTAEAVPQTPAESAGVEIRPPGASGASASTQAPPVLLPPSTRLAFDVVGEVKRFRYSASAELLWRQDGGRYEASQQIKAFLLGGRSQSSVGSITPQGLRPERFGDKARSEQAAHFDFERHEVIFSANTPRATIGDGAQDRLSVFIQLGAMLAAAPQRYPPGTRITLTTVGARKADRWTFGVQGSETLELPAGNTPTLKLERQPPEGQQYEQKAELWLGTALHYLPVRIRLSQANGDFVDLLLSGHGAP